MKCPQTKFNAHTMTKL